MLLLIIVCCSGPTFSWKLQGQDQGKPGEHQAQQAAALPCWQHSHGSCLAGHVPVLDVLICILVVLPYWNPTTLYFSSFIVWLGRSVLLVCKFYLSGFLVNLLAIEYA